LCFVFCVLCFVFSKIMPASLMVVVVVVATTQVATQVARPPRLQPPPLRFKKYFAQVLCFVFCVLCLCFVFCVLCLCFVFCVLCFVFSKIMPASLMVVVVVVATTQVATQVAQPLRLQPPPLRLLLMLIYSRFQSVSVRGRLETSQKSQMEITRSPSSDRPLRFTKVYF